MNGSCVDSVSVQMGISGVSWSVVGAVLGAAFLVAVFVGSLIFLRRFRDGPTAKPTDANTRRLNDVELEKLRKRIEREAARLERERQADRAQEAMDMAKPSAYQEKLRRREEERSAKEQAEAEQQLSKEQEIAKWKSGISVVEEGANNPLRNAASLDEFVRYIRDHKTVEIEAMSSMFRMSVEDIIQRINALESDKLIYGIIDDRGRYTVLFPEELAKIKDAILFSRKRLPLRDLHSQLSHIVSRH